ncbi:MAG: hypothetical protein L0210_07625 [Rhodospirillales bacterium]|nr:hypothetical protein [Rhodospirillales bacterium]
MPSFFGNLLRSRDLLDAQLEFVNLRLDEADPGRPRLRRDGTGVAAIVLRLPPQHVAEQITGGSPSPRLPYKALLSCPSRVAFKIPDNVSDIPFDTEAIFRVLSTCEPLTADPATDGRPASVIEFPDRLLLIPSPAARFFHAAAPATSAETRRTAIWHSRIGVSATDPSSQFRAVPNRVDTADRPFETTLKRRHRVDIVKRSDGDRHVIAASRFMLSALGASATLKSAWPADDSDLLQAWDHDAEGGRDRYVRTAERGYLFPFGHRATLVKITQRRFASHPPVTVAELVQEQILLVQEEERDFRNFTRAYPSDGREMPFKLVRLAPSPQPISSEQQPVSYPATAIDAGGNLIACNLTMLFVPASGAANPDKLRELLDIYRAHQNVDLGNQLVAVADDADRRGEANLIVKTLKVNVKIGGQLREPVHPPFLPVMEDAVVKVPALEHLLATAPGTGVPPHTTITLHPDYLRLGFRPGDKKQVFAKFAPVPGIKIPAERAGGLAAPQFPAIDGLSRTMGPVSGVDGFAGSGSLTPEQLIGEAELLGQIELKRIIGRVDQAADSFPLDQLEALYDKIDADGPGPAMFLTRPMMTTVKRGSAVETRFLWKPKLEQGNFPAPLRRGDRDVELIIKGRINKSFSSPSAPPTFEVEGKLRHFKLEVAGLMSLEFNGLQFKSGAGQKLDVKIDLKAFRFLGDLRFVEEIRNLIPLKSLAGSPIIRPQPDGVVIGYTLPIPAVPLGIFNLQNIALSSSVSISFVEGKPLAVRFALSERNNPFIVSMSIFGGTGFFAVEVRTDGLVRVEAAIEFGGLVSLNLFVIKGGVYLLAGIFVSMDTDGKVLISGYLRFGGYVDVLDLIAVSIEFYIALTYDGSRNVLFGEGRVTVSVKLIFFSESFSFTVRKEVPGFGQAPTERAAPVSEPVPVLASFSSRAGTIAKAARARPTMNLQQWQKYCAAFG